MDPRPSDALDCQACGACCCSDSPGHVPLSGDDHARLTPDEQRELTIFRGIRCFMRMRDGCCVNLRRTDQGVTCAIYPRRPQVCRDYARGGSSCELDRERFMERALARSESSQDGFQAKPPR